MKIGNVYVLDKKEQELVEFVASQRHNNKIKTGWDGTKTVNENSVVDLNIVGFGAEFIFCRELNLYPDFKIHNTSKVKGTDNYDAIYKGKTIDVKVNRNHENPLMIPAYAKTDCNLFALFSCIYPRYRFEGFATNKMVFDESKLRMTRVMAYVTEKADLLEITQVF
tara:strand:+ start:2574 stop:3071 length:498 start_codon:yes stop_codon:yes gene_type:complete